MPPKKGKKISLNEFLGDSATGSWADEMDSLPSAPAARTDDDQGRGGDRFGRRDDFMSTRPERSGPPREDLPLPTSPPYTAFIGNLPFDISEADLEDFFSSSKTKSVKIIKDREEKPKGFGYIEFDDLDGLKDAIAKSGAQFSGRTIRVSVADPPKERERSGFGGSGGVDDGKFDNPWRRDGPLPDLPGDSRDSSRRRFDGERTERLPSLSEGPSDWRTSMPSRPAPVEHESSARRKGFPGESSGAADREEVWSKGSKFMPAPADESRPGSRFGSARGRSEMGPPSIPDEGDWRGSRRSVSGTSPNGSTPPTPQLARRKLELLPRSGTASGTTSPLGSPKIGPSPPTSSRSNPFGNAKPIDVTAREREVSERMEKEKEKHSMSRNSSRAGSERPPRTRTPPVSGGPAPTSSPKLTAASLSSRAPAPTVRPSFSFANAASAKKDEKEKSNSNDLNVEAVGEKLSEVSL